MRLPLSTDRQFENVLSTVGFGVRCRCDRTTCRGIDLVNFRHERKPSTQRFLRPETDLVCYSINWPEQLKLIRKDINALPPG